MPKHSKVTLFCGAALAALLAGAVFAQDTAATTELTPPALPGTPTLPPALPVSPAEVAKFFVDEAGTPGGPYTATQLQALVAAGTLNPATLTWMEGMAAWTRADAVPEVAALLAVPDMPVTPDIMAQLTGTWVQRSMVPIEGVGMGQGDLSMTLTAPNNYALGGTVSVQFNGAPAQILVGGNGTYSVANISGQSFDLVMNGTVSMAIPEMGMGPTSEPLTETTRYEFVDANTLRDTATGDNMTRMLN